MNEEKLPLLPEYERDIGRGKESRDGYVAGAAGDMTATSKLVTKTYRGQLSYQGHGEADEILFLSSVEDPFCEELLWMVGKNVTVRYWTTDTEVNKDEAIETTIAQAMGIGYGNFGACYSEATGYLYTNEHLEVGGHDLLGELQSHVGRWLILEVDYSEDPVTA